MNRLKIVSDGTARGTRLIDTKSGEDVTHSFRVVEITWSSKAGPTTELASVTLTLARVPVEIEGVLNVVNDHGQPTSQSMIVD